MIPSSSESTKAEKRAKLAKVSLNSSFIKETRPFRTEDIQISKIELRDVWNKIFPKKKINEPAAGNTVKVQWVAVPYGEQITVENVFKAASKISIENEFRFNVWCHYIEKAITSEKENYVYCGKSNLARGYYGKQTIYFEQEENYVAIAALRKRFSASGKKIYGMDCVDTKKADFDKALDVVFGVDGDFIFEGVEVDWDSSNYSNFNDYINEEQEKPIGASETDPRLIALREAIDAYNLNKSEANLEHVKIQWLRKLKGNASLPKKEESTEPANDNSIKLLSGDSVESANKDLNKKTIEPISSNPSITKSIPVVIDNDSIHTPAKSTSIPIIPKAPTVASDKKTAKTENKLDEADNSTADDKLTKAENDLTQIDSNLAQTNSTSANINNDSTQFNIRLEALIQSALAEPINSTLSDPIDTGLIKPSGIPQTNYEPVLPKKSIEPDTELPSSKKESTSLGIILLLILVIGVIFAAVSILYWRKKANNRKFL